MIARIILSTIYDCIVQAQGGGSGGTQGGTQGQGIPMMDAGE